MPQDPAVASALAPLEAEPAAPGVAVDDVSALREAVLGKLTYIDDDDDRRGPWLGTLKAETRAHIDDRDDRAAQVQHA